MGKAARLQEIALLPPPQGVTLSHWLYSEIRAAIIEQRAVPGAQLPASRTLATRYGIARGTVVAVYEQLVAEGYVESKRGSGTVVSFRLPEQFLQAGQLSNPVRIAASKSVPSRLSQRGAALSPSPYPLHQVQTLGGAFRANQPSIEAFPLQTWMRLAARRARISDRALLVDADALGFLPLRRAIAGWVGMARGVHCSPEQVVVLSGTQQALNHIARLVLDPGDSVWMEDPGFIGAQAAFKAAGARIVPISVDAQGLDVATAERTAPNARLAYVTPAHSHPLGRTMSTERRLALLSWAQRNGAWIFEDDYDGEFRFSGRPLAALQSLDSNGCVIYGASFGKLLFPSLRISFVVAPPTLVGALANLRSLTDRYQPILSQAVLTDFIVEGHFEQHMRRMRTLYAERRDVLLECAQRLWRGLLDVETTPGGLQTVGWLADGLIDTEIASAAASAKVELLPLSSRALRPGVVNGLQLGFATVPPAEIRRGAERLAGVLENLRLRMPHAQ